MLSPNLGVDDHGDLVVPQAQQLDLQNGDLPVAPELAPARRVIFKFGGSSSSGTPCLLDGVAFLDSNRLPSLCNHVSFEKTERVKAR